MAGTLHIVGTPIGNLGDMSARGIETLKSVKAVAAEDTRHIRRLMTHFGIGNRLVSFREQNRERMAGEILELLREGDVALVTDAGMPCISDPGTYLVARVREAGFCVTAVPGPAAVTTAVALSGLAAGGFVFIGFLPRHRPDMMEALSKASKAGLALVVYEAPGRVRETLEVARDALGDVTAVIARELTKIHEEVVTGTLASLIASLPPEPMGEFVIIFEPAPEKAAGPDIEAIRLEIRKQLESGRHVKDTSRMISTVFGLGGKEAYELALEERDRLAGR
ncbi:MAG: 16S rRNA (cytidine(1402)-2'-O)-methyltransferase [Myxococcota bacterium]